MAKKKSVEDRLKELEAQQKKSASRKKETKQIIIDTTDNLDLQLDNSVKLLDNLKAQAATQAEIKALTDDIKFYTEYTAKFAADLTEEEVTQLKLESEIYKIQLKQAKNLQTTLKNREKINDLFDKAAAHQKKYAEAQEKINKLHDQFNNTIKGSTKFLDDIENTIRDIPLVGNFLADAFNFDDISKKVEEKTFNTIKAVFGSKASAEEKAAEAQIKAIESQVNELKTAKEELQEISELSEDIANKKSSTSGVENISDKMTDAETAASNIAGDLSGGMPKAGAGAEVLSDGLIAGEGASMGILAALGPILITVGAIIAIIYLFVKAAMEIDAHTASIAQNLGISKSKALELTKELNKQQVTFAEQVKYAEMLRESFGGHAKILAEGAIPRMKQLQYTMQLSDETLQAMVEAAYLLGNSLDGSATSVSQFETELANVIKREYEANDLALTQSTFFDQMRETTLAIGKIEKRNLALYGKSGEALFRQVRAVKKLGLEFDTAAKIAEGMLNIESSLENEMKANILLGKHFNLDRLRAASLFGDIEDIARETAAVLEDQNITLAEFNKLTPFKKKQLEDMLGMQADEISTMLLKNKLSEENLKNLKTVKLGSEDEQKLISDIVSKNQDLTAEMVQQLMYQERKSSLEQDMQQVQALLTESLKVNMPGIQSLIETMSDFGLEVQSAGGIGGWILGRGKSAGEIKATMEAESLAKKKAEAEKQGLGADSAEMKDIMNKADKAAATINQENAKSSTIKDIGTTILFGGAYTMAQKAMRHTSYTGEDVIKMGEEKSASTKEHQDFLSRPGQPIQSFSKGDLVMGIHQDSLRNASSGTSYSQPVNAANVSNAMANKEVADLLKTLIAKVDQPVQIKMGTRTVEEIGNQAFLRRTYSTKVDQGYGTFG